jgi:hypothetical protein
MSKKNIIVLDSNTRRRESIVACLSKYNILKKGLVYLKLVDLPSANNLQKIDLFIAHLNDFQEGKVSDKQRPTNVSYLQEFHRINPKCILVLYSGAGINILSNYDGNLTLKQGNKIWKFKDLERDNCCVVSNVAGPNELNLDRVLQKMTDEEGGFSAADVLDVICGKFYPVYLYSIIIQCQIVLANHFGNTPVLNQEVFFQKLIERLDATEDNKKILDDFFKICDEAKIDAQIDHSFVPVDSLDWWRTPFSLVSNPDANEQFEKKELEKVVGMIESEWEKVSNDKNNSNVNSFLTIFKNGDQGPSVDDVARLYVALYPHFA